MAKQIPYGLNVLHLSEAIQHYEAGEESGLPEKGILDAFDFLLVASDWPAQLAAVTAERDEAVAKAEEAISAVEEYLACVHGLEQAKLAFDYGALSEFMDRMIPARDALAAIINKETP